MKMFRCDQFLNEASSEDLLNLHQDKKYDCNICGIQVLTKTSLAQHKRAVHEGVKYSCGQCGKQFTSMGNLAEHKRAVHEGVKYPCGLCSHQ